MDENGDAEGNYTVIALLPDRDAPLGKSMQPVAHFLYSENRHSTLPVRDYYIQGGPKMFRPIFT
jgi:hypothetical protein